jgi:hypothetical protein
MNLFKKYLEVIQESDTKESWIHKICVNFFHGGSMEENLKLEDGNGARTLFLNNKEIARYFTEENEIAIEPNCPEEIAEEIRNIFNKQDANFREKTSITPQKLL